MKDKKRLVLVCLKPTTEKYLIKNVSDYRIRQGKMMGLATVLRAAAEALECVDLDLSQFKNETAIALHLAERWRAA